MINNFITITEPVFSNGKYFKQKEQHCYKDRLMMNVTCPMCALCYKDKVIMHYRIVIDDVNYYIPEYAAVISDCVYGLADSSMIERKKWEEDRQPYDMIKTAKEVLGIDIDNTYKADHDRIREIRNSNFLNYGNVDMSKLKQVAQKPKAEYCPSCDYDETIYAFTSVSLEPIYNVCIGSTITISPTITGLEDRLSFKWNTGETTRDITITVNEDLLLSLVVTDDLGCTYEASTVISARSISVELENQNICSGSSITLTPTISGDIDGIEYLWNTGSITESIEVSPTSTKTYTLIVTNQYGCTDSAEVTVNVYNLETVIESKIMYPIQYGYLYNWFAINDSRYITSEGWHIPSDTEMTQLTDYITSLGLNVGPALTGNYTLWKDGVLRNDNYFGITGFDILPAGRRITTGAFGNSGEQSFIWCSTEVSSSGRCRSWIYNSISITRTLYDKKNGFSTRCMRDATVLEQLLDDFTEVDNYIGNDDREYKAIKINDKIITIWNLTETKFRNGDIIPEVTGNTDWYLLSTAGRCMYDNDEKYIFFPDLYILTAISTGNDSDNITYLWSTGETTSSIEVSPTETTTYTVIVTGEHCISEQSITIVI